MNIYIYILSVYLRYARLLDDILISYIREGENMRKQKILAIVAACVLATSCPYTVTAGEIEKQEVTTEVYAAPGDVILEGDCSATAEDHVTWKVVETENGKYKLIISGTGKMFDAYTNNEDNGLLQCVYLKLLNSGYQEVFITEAEISEGVLNVGDGAFKLGREKENKIEQIILPNGLTEIGYEAFSGCMNLKEISIPNSVTSIGEYAFYSCSGLKEINIPDSVVSICGTTFNGCNSLKEIHFPEGVKEMNEAASSGTSFYEMQELKTVYLPHSLEKIEISGAFHGTSLTDIYYNGTKAEWDKIKKVHKQKYWNDSNFEYEKDDWGFIAKEGVTVHFLDSEITIPEKIATATPKPKPTATPIPEENKAVAMQRLYHPITQEHFYTKSEYEKNVLVSRGWKYEGIGWYAPEKSNTPVYRLYNAFVNDHHYTTSSYEREVLIKKYGWIDEGIGWYSDDDKSVPLYRRYCPFLKSGSHHYTQALNEAKHLLTVGWKDEGIAWYGLKEDKKK